MKLRTLLKDIPDIVVKGNRDIDITGITERAQSVMPKNIFIARPGIKQHGALCIPQARDLGANTVVTDMYDPSLKELTQIITKDPKKVEALLAARYYGHPSDELFMIGVTGTNGKTTTTYILRHLLEYLSNGLCGIIGTIEYSLGQKQYPASHTTPDICSNQKMLRSMVKNSCTACAMEVSSHALDQERVDGIDFDVVLFTNLTHEHLDYHITMEQYAASKKKLFIEHNQKKQKICCINNDSEWASYIMDGLKDPIFTYGITKESDIQAIDCLVSEDGVSFSMLYKGKEVPTFLPFCGRFFIYNALAAASALVTKGYAIEEIAMGLSTFSGVPGRLEAVSNQLGVSIFVDYAHKPDALENVLSTLKEFAKGRIITVFGCGGDRDHGKREKMAQVAERFGDFSIVTSDNPRSESPEAIINAIIVGFSHKECYTIELDRRKAIFNALKEAKEGDIVLIAGKGHETRQVFAHQSFDFDDREVARECCQEIQGERAFC